MKRYIAVVLLAVLCLFTGCSGRGVWGVYRTQADETGKYKRVEFAYSKTFYTDDAPAADAKKDEEDSKDALLEGWYKQDGEQVKCTYTRKDSEDTGKVEYTFRYDAATDTLILDGTDERFEKENGK